MGVNFAGIGYGYTEADIGFDPVLELQDVQLEMSTWAGKYIRTFDLFDKSARIDLTQAYQKASWRGLQQGVEAEAHREGLTDTLLRFSMNLYGSPPLTGRDYAAYRAKHDVDTIVGVAMVMRLPTGDYFEDKLLNLGANRYELRPQLGVSHRRGPWSTELTTEVAFHTDNTSFYGGNTREQEAVFTAHSHVIYTFKPGLWVSGSLGFDLGGETKINGVDKNDKKHNVGFKLSGSYPISRTLGLNLSYFATQTQQSTGADTDSLLASIAYMW